VASFFEQKRNVLHKTDSIADYMSIAGHYPLCHCTLLFTTVLCASHSLPFSILHCYLLPCLWFTCSSSFFLGRLVLLIDALASGSLSGPHQLEDSTTMILLRSAWMLRSCSPCRQRSTTFRSSPDAGSACKDRSSLLLQCPFSRN
jgi:hypothetical protein